MTDTIDTPAEAIDASEDEESPRTRRVRSLVSLAALAGLVVFLSVQFGPWALLVVVGLIVSIVLHELGHYLAAKQAGMKVTEFFIGFGPKLWSFRRGETEYGIKPVPLGAYVRIIGMNNLEDVDPDDEGRTYREKGYWARLRVVLAGPFMNLAIAFVLLFALNIGFGRPSPHGWTVRETIEGTAAASAGVQPGDRVESLAGQSIDDFQQFGDVVQANAGKTVEMVVVRDGAVVNLEPTIGWALGDQVGTTLAPLESGNTPTKVNGVAVADYDQFVAALEAAPAGTATVEFQRAGSLYTTQVVTPASPPADGARGFIGVASTSDTIRQGPVEAAGAAGRQFGDMVTSSLGGIGRFFSPSGLSQYANLVFSTPPQGVDENANAPSSAAIVPVDSGEPPVTVKAPPSSADQNRVLSLLGVIRLGGQAGAAGLVFVITLLALVNLFLGIINLVPLLPFDGGHAAIATYEAIRGRIAGRPYRADVAKLMPVAYAVIAVFLFVGLSSFYLDAVRPAANPFGG